MCGFCLKMLVACCQSLSVSSCGPWALMLPLAASSIVAPSGAADGFYMIFSKTPRYCSRIMLISATLLPDFDGPRKMQAHRLDLPPFVLCVRNFRIWEGQQVRRTYLVVLKSLTDSSVSLTEHVTRISSKVLDTVLLACLPED